MPAFPQPLIVKITTTNRGGIRVQMLRDDPVDRHPGVDKATQTNKSFPCRLTTSSSSRDSAVAMAVATAADLEADDASDRESNGDMLRNTGGGGSPGLEDIFMTSPTRITDGRSPTRMDVGGISLAIISSDGARAARSRSPRSRGTEKGIEYI